MVNYEIIGAVVVAMIAILGGVAHFYRLSGKFKQQREKQDAQILRESKEYTDMKIDYLQKDISYQKELHEGKIAELSEKIEELKEEMRNQHSQLVNLLTKMVGRSRDND